jgi:hypothetical protein
VVVGDIVRCWRGVGICYRRQHRDWLACRHSLGFCGCLRRDSRFKGARRSPAKGPTQSTERQERRPNTKAETQRRGRGDGRRRKIVEGQDSVLLAQTALCPRRPPSAIRHAGRGRLGRDPATSKLQSAIPPTAAGEADTRAMGLPALPEWPEPPRSSVPQELPEYKGRPQPHFAPSATTSVPLESMHCSVQTLKLFNPSQAVLMLH